MNEFFFSLCGSMLTISTQQILTGYMQVKLDGAPVKLSGAPAKLSGAAGGTQ